MLRKGTNDHLQTKMDKDSVTESTYLCYYCKRRSSDMKTVKHIAVIMTCHPHDGNGEVNIRRVCGP